MKFTKKMQEYYGIQNLIALVFIIISIIKHDFFYLAVGFIMSGNLYRVVNYQGDEE